MAKVLGYARVSSDQQDVATQKAKLEMLGAVVVFTGTGNGSSLDGRDQLEAAIRLLDRGDELLVLHPICLAEAGMMGASKLSTVLPLLLKVSALIPALRARDTSPNTI